MVDKHVLILFIDKNGTITDVNELLQMQLNIKSN